jgi:osmotically-inducible protein OsmY
MQGGYGQGGYGQGGQGGYQGGYGYGQGTQGGYSGSSYGGSGYGAGGYGGSQYSGESQYGGGSLYGQGGYGGSQYGGGTGSRSSWRDESSQSQSSGWRSGGPGRRRDFGSQESRGSFAGRGPKGYQRDDNRIREDVSEELTHHPEIDASEIEIRVTNGEITLTGTVPDRQSKRLAEDLVENCSGVKQVHNQLRVAETTGARSGPQGSQGSQTSQGSQGSSQTSGMASSGSQTTGGEGQSGSESRTSRSSTGRTGSTT